MTTATSGLYLRIFQVTYSEFVAERNHPGSDFWRNIERRLTEKQTQEIK